MSTWNASGGAPPYPPPPRRSRSRSPSSYRGGAGYPPPYGDYRADWDAYERDRAWASYERERAAYDYGRRGRSRSPSMDEAGRKRRRSQSPYDTRYDPRPRYDEYDRSGRYSPHRGGPYPPYGSSRHAPPDPHTFDYPSSLKQYAEWFRYHYPTQATEEDNLDKAAEQEAGDGSKPRNGIRARWEKYKKEFAATQLQRMFDHHRKSPWFAEKYDPAPEYANMRMRVRKVGWKGRMTAFLADLDAGKFDPAFTEPEPEPATSPVKETPTPAPAPAESTANGNGSAAVKTEDEAAAPGGEEVKNEQEDVQLEDAAGEDDPSKAEANGKGPVDKRILNRGEEVTAVTEGNQVMIRTIPPDIGRAKLEDAIASMPGFVYLALGDPLQKRNYYRAGWLKFREDADMPSIMSELSEKKIEGFKLHVTHNTKPFVNRVRYAPEVASRPDRLQKDLANVKALAAVLEDEYTKLRTFKPEKPKKPTEGTEGEGENAGGEGEGVKKEEQKEETMDVDEEEDPEPRERGSEAVERKVGQLMDGFVQAGLIDPADEKAFQAKKTVVTLDLYLAYLRAAFHTCYYCAVVTDHVEELQRKCIKHERKPLSKSLREEYEREVANREKAEAEAREKVEEKEGEGEGGGAEGVEGGEGGDGEKKEKEEGKERKRRERGENRDWKRNDERWLEWLDSKAALLINRDGVDPRDYGGKSYDEELSKAVEPYIKQEDESKFRCKTCQKLFKATSFVEKHISNKHPELIKHLDEIPYFNNFALDPHHIQPFTHPPAPVGNSAPPPPQAYGLAGPAYPAGDYGRGGFYGGAPYAQGYPPPAYANGGGGYWDPYAAQAAAAAYPPYAGRRLGDRIGGYAPPGYDAPGDGLPPAAPGLPPKPSQAILEPGPGGGGRRRNTGPPPPPPPDAKEDPRAAAGRKVSYHDMDLVAEGDVELQY
ncbi:hypothetical protein PUNSTDRAFT_84168 [Punctularia strigosozonata HHB-11173 SS5]|uniref:uncharacterized protein n=1 Tax=Punctularia strigosozonata (strain HHB-11173) TaxID=741275 RepID=UPI0004417B91|nr:uncharacterized protein PUNSTDRAFT_84168 [Punctularia strigosozonata HHB-11173 SS5]EIN10253.1 hypothetical protein PUNSTDRAFT_84168 [Punctularia strigosozonata HHB-11173 SS5]